MPEANIPSWTPSLPALFAEMFLGGTYVEGESMWDRNANETEVARILLSDSQTIRTVKFQTVPRRATGEKDTEGDRLQDEEELRSLSYYCWGL